jgi:MFS family permease
MVRKGTLSESVSYGWVMVFVTFVLTALCFGGLSLVAVFIKPLAQEFGWLRGEVASAYTIAAASTAIFGVLFGRVADLRGVRSLTVLGAVTMAACLLLLSKITALWQLYLLFAVFGAFGHAALYVPLTASVAHWFTANRGLAVGIASVGSALGLAITPLIASAIIAESSWRDAWLYLGVGYLFLAIPLVLLVRNPPAASATPASGQSNISNDEAPYPIRAREALLWVCSAAIFCCICMSVPMIHVPSLVSDLGIDAKTAASVLSVMMFAGAIGRVVFGQIMDRFGPLMAYMLASLGQTVFVFWFVQVPSLPGLYLIAAGFGLCFGGVMISILMTIRSLVPIQIAGMAMALAALFGWVAGVVNLAILTALFVRLRHRKQLSFGTVGGIQQA